MVLVNHQQTLSNAWTIIETADLAEDNLLPSISLNDLLTTDQNDRINIVLPISALLSTNHNSLAVETLALIQSKVDKIAVWLDTEHDYKNPYQASEQQLTDLLDATSRKARKTNPLLAALVEALELIVLNVPLFANGRAFSLAQHLRQHDYTGEIRLTGAFGRDQLAYYHRSGVDTFVVSDEEINKGNGADEFFASFQALANSENTSKSANSLPMFRDV